jgi:hypothetical protein
MRREIEIRGTRQQRGALQHFLFDGWETRTVALGGTRFGGKTWTGAFAFGLLCMLFPGVKCLALRRVVSAAELNMGDELRAAFFAQLGIVCDSKRSTGGVQYLSRSQPGPRFVFPNGSVIQLGYCNKPGDWEIYLGPQWDAIWFEQAEQFTEKAFDLLGGSNRPNNPAFSSKMLLTFNPGGLGAPWVQRRIVSDKTRDRRTLFFPASVQNSLATLERDPGYVMRSLRGITDPILREQWWLGNWDILSGVYFRMVPEREDRMGTVQETARVGMPYYADWHCGVDWGYDDPWCCLWFASWGETTGEDEPEKRHIHVVDEVYQTGLDFDQQTWMALQRDKALKEEFRYMHDVGLLRLADASTAYPNPMVRAGSDQSRSVADVWRSYGFNTYPSNRGVGRVAGWNQIRLLLRHGILTIDPRCVNLIREMKGAVRSADNEDISKQCPDHALDSLRYVTTYLFPVTFTVPTEDDPWDWKKRNKELG